MNTRTFRQESAFDADQAELRAVREGGAAVATASLDEKMSGEAMEEGELETSESPFQTPKWEKENIGVTSIVERALEVISERRRLLGNLYPFELNGSGITYKQGGTGLYEFCLFTCEAASNPERSYRRLLRHFERIVTRLLIQFCGDDALGTRFGWPSEAYFDQVSKNIDERIAYLKRACRFDDDEWTLSDSKYLVKTHKHANDARIDVVVRRPLFDDRPGGLTILGQCGCGKHDVQEDSQKHTQLNKHWLNTFFNKVTTPQPLFVFATSQHIACSSAMYIKQNESQSLFLDRIRLVKFASQFPGCLESEKKWMDLLTNYVNKKPPKPSRGG